MNSFLFLFVFFFLPLLEFFFTYCWMGEGTTSSGVMAQCSSRWGPFFCRIRIRVRLGLGLGLGLDLYELSVSEEWIARLGGDLNNINIIKLIIINIILMNANKIINNSKTRCHLSERRLKQILLVIFHILYFIFWIKYFILDISTWFQETLVQGFPVAPDHRKITKDDEEEEEEEDKMIHRRCADLLGGFFTNLKIV